MRNCKFVALKSIWNALWRTTFLNSNFETLCGGRKFVARGSDWLIQSCDHKQGFGCLTQPVVKGNGLWLAHQDRKNNIDFNWKFCAGVLELSPKPPPMLADTSVKHGLKRLDWHADLYTVSRCHTRGESEDHKPESTQRNPPWLWNPEQTSPEVQNRGISGLMKRTYVLQKFFLKESFFLGKRATD